MKMATDHRVGSRTTLTSLTAQNLFAFLKASGTITDKSASDEELEMAPGVDSEDLFSESDKESGPPSEKDNMTTSDWTLSSVQKTASDEKLEIAPGMESDDLFSESDKESRLSSKEGDMSGSDWMPSSSDEQETDADCSFDGEIIRDSADDIQVRNNVDVDVNDVVCVPETDCDSDDSIAFPATQSYVEHNLTVDNYVDEDERGATKKQQQKKCKQHCCKFCQKMNTKMSTHLSRAHRHEAEVDAILRMRKGCPERRKAFIRLQDEGDFKYNVQMLKEGESPIITKYRQKHSQKSESDYVACQYCKALFLKTLLSKHDKKCSQKPDGIGKAKRGQSVRQGRLMMPLRMHMTSSFFDRIISKMRQDDVSYLVQNDSLILKYGERLFSRRDIEEHSSGQISSRLRELGRLCKLLRSHSKMTVSSLTQAVDPANFDLLITCIKEMGQFSDVTNMYGKGSLMLKIGYSLKKASQILKAEAIKEDDVDTKNKCDRFEALYESDWSDCVSACASQSVQRAKMNKPKLLPSLADVEKVNTLLHRDSQSNSYVTLAKATLASITIFNRKRGGEVQRMKCADFFQSKMLPANPPEKELLADLTATEKMLVKELHRVEIRGKFNRPVPILLTHPMVQSIEKLLSLRHASNIESEYLFVTPTGMNPFRGPAVLKEYAKMAAVTDPMLFTATALRKQLATLSQAMEISKLKQDQLASFLGHDIRVHRSVYRQPLEIMQKAKVASILFRVNRGMMVDGGCDGLETEELEEDEQNGHDEEEEIDGKDENCIGELSEPVEGPGNVETGGSLSAHSSASDKTKKKTRTCSGLDSSPNASHRQSPELSTNLVSSTTKQDVCSQKPRSSKSKRPWSEDEKAAVKRRLSHCISMNLIPQKHDAERALAMEPVLRHRSWTDVKYCVYNMLKKKTVEHKILSPFLIR